MLLVMNELTNNEILLKWLPFMEELKQKWAVSDDCMQLFYLEFLEYDNKKLNDVDKKKNEMKYFIVRWLKNQWFSETSRYHYQYRKYYEWNKELKEKPEEDDDD